MSRNKIEINPNTIIEKLFNIQAISKEYFVDDLYITKHTIIDSTNIMFIVSKSKKPRALSKPYLKFVSDLYRILEIDITIDAITLKENPGFFETNYPKHLRCSLLTASIEDIKHFIKDTLELSLNA